MATRFAPATPLSPAVFAILLSLAEGEQNGASGPGPWGGKHGYLIMKDARAPRGGGITLGPGTLYGSLERMMILRLVFVMEIFLNSGLTFSKSPID